MSSNGLRASGRVPGLSAGTLDNGLSVIVIENHNVPLASIEIAVRSGAYVEPPEMWGLSHLYEHMFFKGNRALPNQERYLERLRELGASFNGTTGSERVNYYITLPSENLREGTVFMRDALLFPLFQQQELERERVVVLGEFDRNEASPGWHLGHQMDRKMWWKHLSRKVPLGDREIIVTATREQMLQLKERYYVPNNAALLFAGDVEPGAALELAAELFGAQAWPRGEDPHQRWPEPKHPPLPQSSRIAVVQPVQVVTLQVAWHGPSVLEDAESTFAADVLGYILNQPTSRFHHNLIDSGLFDGVGLSYYSQRNTGPIGAGGLTSADRLDRAHAALLVEIQDMARPDYYSDEELEFAKMQLEYGEIYSREKSTSFIHGISFWWATAGLDYFERYLENLRSVRREDIEAFVRRYLHGQPSITGLLLAEADLETIELARGAEVIRPQKGSSATALQAQSRAQHTEVFEVDGVRVLLRHNRFSEVVSATAYLDGGLAYAGAERAGLELLMLSVAEKQSRSYPKEVMARELTRLGAALGGEPAPDYSSFALYALRKHLKESFALFLDALVHPAFTEEEVALARERRLTVLGLQEQDPGIHLDRMAVENLYKEHPFALNLLGRRETIAAVRAEDLERLHAQSVHRSRLFLVVVGDLGREELERLIGPALRELPVGEFQRPVVPPIPEPQRRSLRTEERDLPTVYVEGLFPAPDLLHPDFAALYIGMYILNDRLFEEIRTRRNLSYAPGADLSRRSANLGRLTVSSTDPNACVRIMLEEIQRLQRSAVSETRLKQSVNDLRTRFLESLQTSADIAGWLGEFELYGGGWQRLQQLLDDLGRLTPEQVRAAMDQHVHNLHFAVLGPLAELDRELLQSF